MSLDGPTGNPLSSLRDGTPAGFRPTGFDRAYGEVRRSIRQAWHRVHAYRALTQMERDEGNEIEARRWQRYRAETLRDIRMLRESVR
jgi:hypothetical protein